MAFSIITGSLSTIDVSLGGSSVKSGFARLSTQITRAGFPITTFSSGGWVEEITGQKQMTGSIIGYAGKSTTWSDPSVWVTSASAIAFVGTADTSCTISSNINVFSDGIDLVAAGPGSRGVDFRSTASVTTAWTTS